jgi:hypothetical protein
MHDISSDSTSSIRYFIVNLGRSGSSLLGAVLADAGAEFGLPVPATWDPRTGQMEARAIKNAAHHYRRAYDIGEGRKYVISPAFETKYRLGLGKWYLRRALRSSRYLKISDLDLVVQASFKLGFSPRVILNYRQLEFMLPSLLVGRTHSGPDQIAGDYLRIYRQGLVLLQSFGGCVVAYNDLQDPRATEWATALSGTTQLALPLLLDARARRLQGIADAGDTAPVYADALSVFNAMESYRGQVVEPARQVERALAARRD